MQVTVAKREKLKVPIMISGASGSGKTVSSLLIAKGIIEGMFPDLSDDEQWLKIGLIDTENKRALLYESTEVAGTKIGSFLHVDMEPPYTVENYSLAFNLLKKESVEVVIVDSISHAWSGEGGTIDEVENITKGNKSKTMIAWAKVTPSTKQFMRLITCNSLYVIATARAKQSYEIEKNEHGRTEVRKLGLKPDQKETLEYEFAICLRMEENHTAIATKDNSNIFKEPFEITTAVGYKIFEWSDLGIDRDKVKRDLIESVKVLANSSIKKSETYEELMSKMKGVQLEDIPIERIKNLYSLLEGVKEEDEKQSEPVQENTISWGKPNE